MRLASAPALSVALVLAPFAASALTFTVNNGTNDILVGAANCRSLNLVAA